MGMNNFTGGSNGTGNNGNVGGSIGGFPFPTSQTPAQTSSDATEYLINYNERFKTAGNAMFRDAIVSQTMAVLIGKNKPNALLVGSAGVGKTKIVEDIAYRIESKDLRAGQAGGLYRMGASALQHRVRFQLRRPA